MLKAISLFSLLLLTTISGYSQSSKELNLNGNHLAIEGFDPVSYFRESKPVEGKSTITYNFEGATYQFATIANKEAFISSPDSYKPQYGGWCAYAMGAKGEKVEVDPETFKILDGKLYLFYNRLFNNTLESWNKNENQLRSNADKNWKALLAK